MSSPLGSSSLRPARPELAAAPCHGEILTHGAICCWLGFAVLLFLLQTIPYLSCRWVTDESWYAGPAYSLASGDGIADPAIGPNDLENHFDARPPGTAMVIAAAFKLFGTGQVSARLGSVLAGLAIVLLTFRLARDVLGDEAALVSAFLVATDNLIVLTSRSARPEALTTLAILASLLAMKQYAQQHRIGWAFLSGLLIAMGTMFHVTVAGYIVSFGILAVVFDRRRGGFWLRGGLSYAVGYGLGLVPFAAWIMTAPLGRAGFRQEFLSRAVNTPLWSKFLQEGHRYSDLLGLNMLHGHGLESIPIRLPIPLFVITASFLLWKLRRKWFYLELLLLAPSTLWLVYTVNKSSRYLTILAPVFALAMGAAVAATGKNSKLHRVVTVCCCLVIATQLSANLFLLHAARNANYDKVAAELRSVIPPGQAACGTITFWLALHDHPYISYERTDPLMAANQFNVRYFISGDRVLMNGLPGGETFFADLRQNMAEAIAHGKLVGHFPDPYYGDLKVYELRAP